MGVVVLLVACPASDEDGETDPGTTAAATDGPPPTSTGAPATTAQPTPPTTMSTSSTTDPPEGSSTTSTTDPPEGSSTTMVEPACPEVDATDPQLYSFEFAPSDADPAATLVDETQLGYLDTSVPSRGTLVVYLHGAGSPTTCGSRSHGEMLAGLGFHYFSPCYLSNYGVGNCDDDIGGCRLEAFEGVDHHELIDVTPPDSIETRVVRGLEYLQAMNPEGDWTCFIDGDVPAWDRVIITGSSHGASTSGVIGMNRVVERVVSLSGPLDSGQAWLLGDPMTPIERFYGFTHTGDSQHPGHLDSFADLGIPGDPVVVDGMDPPYGDSQRLVTSAATDNGHSSTSAGGASPMTDGEWDFLPVWQYMYGAI